MSIRPSPSRSHFLNRILVLPGWWFGGLVLLAGLVYFPALRGEFLWDDAGHVTKATLRSWEGLGRIWFHVGATQQYYPVLHTAFWLEHRLWGDAPMGYHAITIAFHALAAGLFGTFLQRIGVPGARLAALLFLLHPVCVESVAWIAEQKNTLSTVLYLSAALFYLRFAANRTRGAYLCATFSFVLALLTKSVTATLPAALLLVTFFQKGRLNLRTDVLPLLPWFALGAGFGLHTVWVERTLIGAQGPEFDLTLPQRIILAGRAVWFYFGKLVWPAELVFVYPRWTLDAAHAGSYLFPATAVALVAALTWVPRVRRGPLVAVLYFGGTLFPVLGFVNVYPFIFSYVADHFQYLASLGLFALAGAGLHLGLRGATAGVRWPVLGVTVLALGTLTFHRSAVYRDQTTLYTTTIAQNPACWMAHNNLGDLLLTAGRVTEAIRHFEAALRIKPDHAPARNNLGNALARDPARAEEAMREYRQALVLRPHFAEAHFGLATLLLRNPDTLLAAIDHYISALQAKPNYPEAHANLGVLLTTLPGRGHDAIAHLQHATRLKPDYVDAHSNLALVLANTPGRQIDAIGHYEQALRYRPALVEARLNLALLLSQYPERHQEAVAHAEFLLRSNPGLAAAQALHERLKAGPAP